MEGIDFHLAFSPERIDRGRDRFELANTPKVVAGLTEACSQFAERFYAQLVPELVVLKELREAELSNLLEITYRQVNVALMNELAQFCFEIKIDLWDAIRHASTKHFGLRLFSRGLESGGHCIPIDTNSQHTTCDEPPVGASQYLKLHRTEIGPWPVTSSTELEIF